MPSLSREAQEDGSPPRGVRAYEHHEPIVERGSTAPIGTSSAPALRVAGFGCPSRRTLSRIMPRGKPFADTNRALERLRAAATASASSQGDDDLLAETESIHRRCRHDITAQQVGSTTAIGTFSPTGAHRSAVAAAAKAISTTSAGHAMDPDSLVQRRGDTREPAAADHEVPDMAGSRIS